VYRDFFRLDRMPFDNTPDPRFFFATPEHEEALAALRYGVLQRRGITIITGGPGCGKTLLGRVLVTALQDQIDAAFVTTGHDSGHELIAAVCRAFEVRHAPSDTTGELIDHLHAVLSERLADGRIPTVFVDDGQNLSGDTLEHLRLLGNLETDTGKLLQVVLMGQPELAARLRTPGLEPVRQRVFCSRRIAPFTLAETRAYMPHRLALAGVPEDTALFTDGAVELIHERSGGVPRWINQIADNGLLVAFGVSRSTVDRELVLEAIDHMMSVQLLPRCGPEAEARGPGPVATAGEHTAVCDPSHERLRAISNETDRAAARIDSALRAARDQADDTARVLDSRSGQAVDLLQQLRAGQDLLRSQLVESEALLSRLQAQMHAASAATAQAAGLGHQLATAEQSSATLRARVDEGTALAGHLREDLAAVRAAQVEAHQAEAAARAGAEDARLTRTELDAAVRRAGTQAAQAADAIRQAGVDARQQTETLQARLNESAGLADRLDEGLRALRAVIEEAQHAAETTRTGAREAQTAGVELEQTVQRLGQTGQSVVAELTAKSNVAIEWLDRLQTCTEVLEPTVVQAQHLTQDLRVQGDKLRAAAEHAQAMGTHLERLQVGAEAALGQTLQRVEHLLQRAAEVEHTVASTTERSRTHAATLAATAQAWHEQLNGLLRDLKNQVQEVQEASHQAMYAPLRTAGAAGDIATVRELLQQSLHGSRAEKTPA
jgi:type II secretory pathway predicted ATPase ExeA